MQTVKTICGLVLSLALGIGAITFVLEAQKARDARNPLKRALDRHPNGVDLRTFKPLAPEKDTRAPVKHGTITTGTGK